MIIKSVRQSPIFSDFTPEEQTRYFSIKDRKVTSHVDTLYYTVSIYNDSNSLSEGVAAMLDQLKVLKEKKAQCYANEVEFFGLDVECTRFVHYEYCLRLNENFDIFVSSILPNVHTPRIVVQLRTRALVLNGVYQAICQSFRYVETILQAYGLEVGEVKENRIDYAYHTNLIQNPTTYFGDSSLLHKLKTKLRKYHKVGEIGKNVEIDYLSFGMRNSNNIFVRIYNKSREVVEKNYKSFFLEKWLTDELISNYDHYVYQKAYSFGSFVTGLLVGRIDWYLEHGKNEEIKSELLKVKSSCYQNSDNTEHLREIVDRYLPPVTLVLNIEFQTKRKFYATLEDWFSQFGIALADDCGIVRVSEGEHLLLARLNRLCSVRAEICKYLTSECLCFVDHKKTENERFSAWWRRIHDCKIDDYSMDMLKVFRVHERHSDIEKSKRRVFGAIAQLSILKNISFDKKTDFVEDISDVLCMLNDNDFYGFAANPDTGEIPSYNPNDYGVVKKRKIRQYRFLEKEKLKGEKNNEGNSFGK